MTAPLQAVPKRKILCAGLFGLWVGLGLLKFGNPPLFAQQIPSPTTLLEVVLNPWPLSWSCLLVAITLVTTFGLWRWPMGPHWWVIALPGLWFAWQIVAALHTIDSALSGPTLLHFLTVASAFYLGFAALANLPDLRLFWLFFLSAMALVLVIGCHQHFIGLEETRRYFNAYELPKYPNGPPPELLKKLASNRIYATLFYPNTLATALILGLPLLVTKTYLTPHATRSARLFLVGVFGLLGVLCLFWSGSKAGWLIALIMLLVAVLHVNFSRRIKLLLLIMIFLTGAAGFIWRYSAYLQRGATSASARVDYWRAAVHGFIEAPLFGSGPGTFMLTYKRLKTPDAEMARLAHNDYLQQACDSGLPGFIIFTTFIVSSLGLLYRSSARDPTHFAIWLSLLGVSLHGFVEFNLYVPAVAWPQFLLFGWLAAQSSSASSSFAARRYS